MGKLDILTKQYISDNRIFADVFNFFIYGGNPVIRPEDLQVMDTTAIAVPYGKEEDTGKAREAGKTKNAGKVGKVYPVQKYRDVLKSLVAMEGKDMVYLILGLEEQTNIHYAMPPRSMLYDAMEYTRQIEMVAARHREKKDWSHGDSGEFLSGFGKEDRLIPVFTLVVYFGPENWTAPRTLQEMFFGQDEKVLPYLNDYKINLLVPAELSDADFEKFNTDLREVMKYIKYSKNKKKLSELVENDKEFSHISHRTAVLLNECTHSELKFHNSKGRVDMCQAIKEIREEGRQEGREEGRREGREEGRQEGREEGRQEGREEGRQEGRVQATIEMGMSFGMPDGEILKMLQEKLDISFLKAHEYFRRFGKQEMHVSD